MPYMIIALPVLIPGEERKLTEIFVFTLFCILIQLSEMDVSVRVNAPLDFDVSILRHRESTSNFTNSIFKEKCLLYSD